ncbi:Zip3/RNF212-like protein [Aduncisulcus paluster]|uniref:Zip3/RNF212-like protein n=1 Tax=Aduncisulcus paluster TaxID=2918883 RepID=A0ABQ5KGQ0_9EUKA|nr:Zip3/RNF212-like protein [Aduncisulcus paluster]
MPSPKFYCNICWRSLLFDQPNAFTSCGHFICAECQQFSPGQDIICPFCSSNCSTIPISHDLSRIPGSVRRFFMDPQDLLSQAIEVYKFQVSHRNARDSSVKEQLLKFSAVSADLKHAKRELQDPNGIVSKLKGEISSLRSSIERMRMERKRMVNSSRTMHKSSEKVVFSRQRPPEGRGMSVARHGGNETFRLQRMELSKSARTFKPPKDMAIRREGSVSLLLSTPLLSSRPAPPPGRQSSRYPPSKYSESSRKHRSNSKLAIYRTPALGHQATPEPTRLSVPRLLHSSHRKSVSVGRVDETHESSLSRFDLLAK